MPQTARLQQIFAAAHLRLVPFSKASWCSQIVLESCCGPEKALHSFNIFKMAAGGLTSAAALLQRHHHRLSLPSASMNQLQHATSPAVSCSHRRCSASHAMPFQRQVSPIQWSYSMWWLSGASLLESETYHVLLRRELLL